MAIPTELATRPRRADRRLVRRCLEGDLEAQRALVDRLRCVPRFLGTLNDRMGGHLSEHDLADLSQDTLVVLLGKLEEYEGRGRLESWAYRFCFLEFMNRLRYLSRWSKLLETRIETLGDRLAVADPPVHQEHDALEARLSSLEPREAEIIRLKHTQDLTFNDIGARLSLSPNSVKTYYYRGLTRLRRRLTAPLSSRRLAGE